MSSKRIGMYSGDIEIGGERHRRSMDPSIGKGTGWCCMGHTGRSGSGSGASLAEPTGDVKAVDIWSAAIMKKRGCWGQSMVNVVRPQHLYRQTLGVVGRGARALATITIGIANCCHEW